MIQSSTRRDPRRIVGAPFLVVYVLAFGLGPVTIGPFRYVAAMAAGGILFCTFAVIGCRLLPGVDSWADVGLRRPDPLRWWAAGLLTAATSFGYVTVQWISQMVGDAVTLTFSTERTGIAELSTPNPTELTADIVRSVHTATKEELLYFAVPLAIGALGWRRATGRWFPIRIEHRLIAIATCLAIVSLRVLGHLYWGFPGVLITVIPWMAGAWLIFRLCGTVWPLIIGHVAFDIFTFAMIRSPDCQWLPATFAVVVFAGTCVIFAGPTVLPLSPLRMFRSNLPTPAGVEAGPHVAG